MKNLALSHTLTLGVLLCGCELGTDIGNTADGMPGNVDDTATTGDDPAGTGNPTAGTGNPTAGTGSSTDGTGGPHFGEGWGCKATNTQAIELDAQTPLDVTAAEILALAEGEQTFQMEWMAEPLNWGAPAGTTTELTLRVQLDASGGARFVRRKAQQPTDGSEIGLPECPDQIEVDVRVELSTADGALDEAFKGVLAATDADMTTWSATLPVEELQGTFEFRTGSGDQALTADAITTEATHTSLGTKGGLSVQGSFAGPGGGGFAGALAHWPAGNDCDHGLPVELDTKVGETSLQDALAVTQTALPGEIDWSDREATDLTFMLSLDDESGCATLPLYRGERQSLRARGAAELVSDDSRLDTSLPVEIRVDLDETGTPADVNVTHDWRGAYVEAAQFAQHFGLQDVSLEGYGHGGLQLQWTHSVRDGNTPGSLVVYGVDVPGCIANPQPTMISQDGVTTGGGSAGCRGVDGVPLLEAELR